MPKLPVKSLPSGDNGRLLVRLNYKHRDGVERYGIAKITNNANKESQIVLVLGHDAEDGIFMPYDIRTGLGVSKPGDDLDFTIQKSRFLGRICWYVSSPDPAVSIPARIAIIGVSIAIVGLGIKIVSLICSQAV